jgi:hypothetical protein
MKMDWQLQHNFETVLKIIDLQNETVKNIKHHDIQMQLFPKNGNKIVITNFDPYTNVLLLF